MQQLTTQEQTSRFDLTNLTKFNPALVYGFDPEASIKSLSQDSLAYLAHLTGQWEDVFSAYYYAEHTILPAIQEQGIANIKPEQLLQWLNELHLRIAATLAKDQGVSAGNFIQGYASRWHNGNIIEDIIYIYLSKNDEFLGKSFPYLFEHLTQENFSRLKIPEKGDMRTICLRFLVAYGVEEQDGEKFLQLLDKITAEVKITDQAKRVSSLNLSNEQADIAMGKFRFWYSDCNPSDKEKAIVNKIVIPFLPPEKLPAAMKDFATNLLAKWRVCNPNNLNEVADLLYEAFNTLAGKIHPYFNANGRLATCLVNLILVSFGQPSILLRNPQERNDPTSSYSLAIKHITSDPNLLLRHFISRIQEAREGKAYSNLTLAKIVSLRIELNRTLSAIRTEFPELDVEKLNQALNEKANRLSGPTDEGNTIILRLEFLLQEFSLQRTLKPIIRKYNSVGCFEFEQVLRRAAAKGDCDAIESLIQKVPGLNINKKDDNPLQGKTALHWAVINGHMACVKVLLKHDAKKDILDSSKRMNAVQYAEAHNRKDILELLNTDVREENLSISAQQI